MQQIQNKTPRKKKKKNQPDLTLAVQEKNTKLGQTESRDIFWFEKIKQNKT